MTHALLVIDMQCFVEQRIASGVESYPAHGISQAQQVLNHFRAQKQPVIFVFHHALSEDSELYHTSPAARPLDRLMPHSDEKVVIKHTSSAFTATQLAAYLQEQGIEQLTVIGAVAGFCVNSTVRAAADLGFSVTLVEDAVISFALQQPALSAHTLWLTTLGLLAADFAMLTTSSQVISANEDYFK